MPDDQSDDLMTKLLEALQQGAPENRRDAARALRVRKQDIDRALPALIGALTDVDAFVRLEAANSLGHIGRQAIPALVEALQQQEAEDRKPLLFALGKIRGGRAAVAALGSELLEEFDRANALPSPREWPRLLALHSALNRVALPVLILALLLAFATAGLGTISFHGGRVLQHSRDVGLAVGGAWAVIGVCLGTFLGSKILGSRGAWIGAIATGLTGASTGFLVGWLFATLLHPVAEVLAAP